MHETQIKVCPKSRSSDHCLFNIFNVLLNKNGTLYAGDVAVFNLLIFLQFCLEKLNRVARMN